MGDNSIKLQLLNKQNGDHQQQNKHKKNSMTKAHKENVYIEDFNRTYDSWQKNHLHKFIEIWQSIFNRRILNFYKFTIQVGDVLFFLLIVAYLVVSLIFFKKEKNSGEQTQFMLGLTIIFGCRNGLISYIFGLSFERAIFWHKFMAWVTLCLSGNHWYHARGILSGYFVGGVLSTFVLFSIEPIRRYFWEFFMKLHWLLIILMLASCIIHEVGAGILAICYFALDIAFRVYTIRKYKDLSANIKLKKIGNDIVKLSMNRQNIIFKGGQYFFIMIPKLSYFQWHPFSAFSAPNEKKLVFYIKKQGNWTNALFELANSKNKGVDVKGYIDGPYGSHSISVDGEKYKNFLCVSGGIGITPIFSLTKQLIYQMDEGRPVQNLHFIWVGRDKSIIESVLDDDELKKLNIENVQQIVKSFLHFTNVKASNVIKERKQQKGQRNVKYELGRPDFSIYFENMHKLAKKSQNHLVAVLVCGPQSLIQIIENHASKYSTDGVRFDIHQEVFEL